MKKPKLQFRFLFMYAILLLMVVSIACSSTDAEVDESVTADSEESENLADEQQDSQGESNGEEFSENGNFHVTDQNMADEDKEFFGNENANTAGNLASEDSSDNSLSNNSADPSSDNSYANSNDNAFINHSNEEINANDISEDLEEPTENSLVATFDGSPEETPVVGQENLEDYESSAAREAQPQAQARDLYPVNAVLQWVGFEYLEKSRVVIIKLMVKGKPKFEVFQEKNRAGQTELVVRYFSTSLRKKIHWDIDATEFKSPVGYIRMRENPSDQRTDVVMTMRDESQPMIFAKEGNIQLTFKIPDKYYDKRLKNSGAEAVAVAERLDKNAMRPLGRDRGGSQPLVARSYTPNLAGNVFVDVKDGADIPGVVIKEAPSESQHEGGLPPSFDNQGENSDGTTGEGQENWTEPYDTRETGGAYLDPLLLRYDIDNYSIGAVAQDNYMSNDVGDSQSDTFQNSNGTEGNFDLVNSTENGSDGAFDAPLDVASRIDLQGVEDPAGSQRTFSGKPLVIDFHEAPLNIVLQVFEEESGNNFLYPKEVGDLSVSLRLRNVPWDEALRGLLETYGLAMVMVGPNVAKIDQIQNMTNYLRAVNEARLYKDQLLPTKVLVMRLSNGKAADMSITVAALLAQDIAKDARIKIGADERTNSLIIEAPEIVLGKVKSMVERMDLEIPQVEIAARIVEVSRTARDFLGIVWQSSFNYAPNMGLGFGSLTFPNSIASDFTVDPGVAANPRPGNFQLNFGSLNNFLDLDLLLKMEETRGTTNIIQSTKVLCRDRRPSTIISGTTSFFRPPAAGGVIVGGGGDAPAAGGEGQGLSQINFNLSLEVTPEITAQGMVNMQLTVASDTPVAETGQAVATKSTREVKTEMAKYSGETAVIGGIYDTKMIKSEIGIPFLSRIPILGALFRSTNTTEEQLELLIMVTPTIVTKSSNSGDDGGYSQEPSMNSQDQQSNANMNNSNNANMAQYNENSVNHSNSNSNSNGASNANQNFNDGDEDNYSDDNYE